MRQAFVFTLVVLFLALVSVDAVENLDLKALKYSNLINGALRGLSLPNVVKQFPNARSRILDRTNGTKCSEQMALLFDGLQNGSEVALKMIDASSKIPSGMLAGNVMDLGMYDECVKISAWEDGQEIRGRHCMYSAIVAGTWLKLSICLPSSCGSEDIEGIVNGVLELLGELVNMDIPMQFVEADGCSSLDQPKWTTGGIVTLVGLGLLLVFLVGCTVCDIFARYSSVQPSENGPVDMLRQFSVYSNAVRVFSTKTSPQTLPALQGLRFFSMCLVILGHGHTLILGEIINLFDFIEWIPSWNSLYLWITPFAVETFFTMSGFLMSYIFLKEMSTGRSFNIFGYYIHRYIRLTPAFAAMILMTIFIFPRLGSGPIWEDSMAAEEQACRDKWWTMLLYVHNYVTIEGQSCLSHTWYLAVEMQFFWISPLILYPLAKKPKIGLGILAAFFIASVVVPVKIGYDNKYSAFILREIEGDTFYTESYIRAAPWLIGIFFGYLIFKQKGSSTSMVTKWIGWLLATVAFAFCIFSVRVFQNVRYEYDYVWESIYTALARPFWGFAVSWVIYASVLGFGGPVSKFLSFSIYTPLSRISYCVYLVHHVIQLMRGRAMRTFSYFSVFKVFDTFLSDLMLSIMVGLVFTLVIESPLLVLEKIVKKRTGRVKDNSQNFVKPEEEDLRWVKV